MIIKFRYIDNIFIPIYLMYLFVYINEKNYSQYYIVFFKNYLIVFK